MKGQSAIEYLTTYGWMLLAVSVAAGTTFGTLQDSCTRNSAFVNTDTVGIDQFGLTNDGYLSLAVQNNEYERVEVKGLEIDAEYMDRSKNTSVTVEPGEISEVSMPGFSTSGTCRDISVKFIYDRGPLEDQVIEGTLTAQIDMEDLPLPDAPRNLSVS